MPEPEALLQRSLRSFHHRFPLVLEDLLALPAGTAIVAEGFGLLPALVAPVLSSPHQAAWLIPTESFKRASMTRRNKPSFAREVSDPRRAADNLFRRDMLLAALVRKQAEVRRLTIVDVDGSQKAGEVADALERQFAICEEVAG